MPLAETGFADPLTLAAILTFQRTWLTDPKLHTGVVDPGGVSLAILNDLFAANVRVTSVTELGASPAYPFGRPDILHFVTPRQGGKNVTLSAKVSPGNRLAEALLAWEGATPIPGDPKSAVVPAFPSRKQEVRIKRPDGTVIQEIRVWVIWCDITGRKLSKRPGGVDEASEEGGKALEFSAPWTFTHWISPPGVITEPDRPHLIAFYSTTVPGGPSLARGAKFIWDASRQRRVKMLDPHRIEPSLVDEDWPKDPVVGNDDDHTDDEDDYPYDQGRRSWLKSWDRPSMTLRHARGKAGDTFERRVHFSEFTRIDLGLRWLRISDDFPWRVHFCFKHDGTRWQNNGSVTEDNNDDFDLPPVP
jgi:hypothetical protein